MKQPSSIIAALSLLEKKDESNTLGLAFAKHDSIATGKKIGRADAQNAPKISYHKSGGKYIVVCLDADAPFPSWNAMSPILHWIQSDLVPATTSETDGPGPAQLTSETHPIVDYAPPGPPPGSGPHRYIFILYEQPANFDYKKFAPKDNGKVGIWPRVRYDIAAFEKKAGLGGIVAANYFLSN